MQEEIQQKSSDVVISLVISVTTVICVCLIISLLIGNAKKRSYLAYNYFLELSKDSVETNLMNCKHCL